MGRYDEEDLQYIVLVYLFLTIIAYVVSVVFSWNEINYRMNAIEAPASLVSTTPLPRYERRGRPLPAMMRVKYSFFDSSGTLNHAIEEYRASVGVPSPLLVQYFAGRPESSRLKRPRSRASFYVMGVCIALFCIGTVWTCLEVRRVSRWTLRGAT